ncbi:hypothetical protein T05_7111 [Trichinella murrelli]|uniref:Uncharacterized protein n=1 Tax=Trichinella murrelli TaxID=144512 RepID=A0A0V0T663_9BILA|nr:hypothetical protein T05_7111 [Trichinella murrelli]
MVGRSREAKKKGNGGGGGGRVLYRNHIGKLGVLVTASATWENGICVQRKALEGKWICTGYCIIVPAN